MKSEEGEKDFSVLSGRVSRSDERHTPAARDPRGPLRTIVAVTREPGSTRVTLSCGHVGERAHHFDYVIGSENHCFHCGAQQP